MSIQELIDKVPLEFRPFVQTYVHVMDNMITSEFEDFVAELISGQTLSAYETFISNVPTEELGDYMDNLNSLLKKMNIENAESVEAQEEILLGLVTTALAALKAKV